MRAKNRLTPYPILSSSSNDYIKGEFETEITEADEYGYLNIHVDFNLDSEYLKSLIDSNKAVYVTHIECPRTSYREQISSNVTPQIKQISLKKVTDIVEVNTFIIASDTINHQSDDFNSDYEGRSFQVEKNEILAIGDAKKITLSNNTRDLDSLPSIISIIKVDTAEKSMVVDTDSEYIKIKLSGKLCDQYRELGNQLFKYTSFSLILFPALVTVLTRMVYGKDNDGEMISKRWYQIIETVLEKKGCPLQSLNLSDNSIIDACQRIFEDPISQAFNELNKKRNSYEN